MLFAGIDTNNNVDGVLGIFSAASTSWVNAIKPAGMYLFMSFIVIDFVLTFGAMALKGTEVGAILWTLIEKIMWIGFFLLFFNSVDYLKMIPESFAQIAANATDRNIEPDTILEAAMQLVMALWDGMTITDIGRSIAAVIAGAICLVAFGLMAAQLFMTLVKIQMLIAGSYIVISLGGLSYTRSMAVNPIKALFAAGMELMFIKLVLALTISTIEQLQASVGNDTGSYVAIIVMSIVLASVVQMINGVVNSLMSGSLGGNSVAGLGVAAGVVGGAMAGAAATAKGAAGMSGAVKAAKGLSAAGQGSTIGNIAKAVGAEMVRKATGADSNGTLQKATQKMNQKTQSINEQKEMDAAKADAGSYVNSVAAAS
ncbi:MAG: P-type conjugative transfer protein TrbL [Sulfuricurvum sp.]|uniref:P-type conjugative transfer protein TrbL n=1 Tax=Sulfuricurvum sp. TaxID=2025608 RepID=UPI0025E4B5A0|nr:P-type conjugative transfer protein TrbL [Sulfuricurvum sp.]MBV5320900.1 P-type conjugative transfer protein TrbL [Sulfuricurvum sp.]